MNKTLIKGVAPEIPEGKKWVIIDNVIYVKVTSNGRAGEAWTRHLEAKRFHLSKSVKDVLRSSDFKATTGIVYTLAIMCSAILTKEKHFTKDIRIEAQERKWLTPPIEVGCLLRDLLSFKELEEELGILWIVTMHEPIKDSNDNLQVLSLCRVTLDIPCGMPNHEWNNRGGGFIFVFQSTTELSDTSTSL